MVGYDATSLRSAREPAVNLVSKRGVAAAVVARRPVSTLEDSEARERIPRMRLDELEYAGCAMWMIWRDYDAPLVKLSWIMGCLKHVDKVGGNMWS